MTEYNILDEYHRHILCYGDPGTEKSRFLATLPKPMLVWFFDPLGKDFPYLRRGRPQNLVDHAAFGGIPTREVWHSKIDSPIITLEYYVDKGYDTQQIGKVKRSGQVFAYEKLLARLQTLEGEVASGCWASLVIDSMSSFEIAVRKFNQYKQNPVTNDGNKQDARQWYFDAADQQLELMYSRIAWLPIVVGVAAHVKNKEDRVRGEVLWVPDFPGAVPRRAPGAFSEVYYSYIDEEGQAWLQTRKNEKFIATTQYPAPNPCPPLYKCLSMTEEELQTWMQENSSSG